MTAAQLRGCVVRDEREHGVTYRTYLDGQLLGNAFTEDEGWRWIEDMLKMEAVPNGT